MHEWSIAENLVQQLIELGQREKLKSISTVFIKVGVLRQVVNETLESAFTLISEETVARNSLLKIDTVSVRLKCRHCGAEQSGQDFIMTCLQCGSSEIDIASGKELFIDYIEGEKRDK